MNKQEKVKICVVGGAGRMGRRVLEVCHATPELEALSVLVRPQDKADDLGSVRVETDPAEAFKGVDVVIDFSAPPSVDRTCLLYTSPSPRDKRQSRMPSSA